MASESRSLQGFSAICFISFSTARSTVRRIFLWSFALPTGFGPLADTLDRLDHGQALFEGEEVLVVHAEPLFQKRPDRLQLPAFLIIGPAQSIPHGLDLSQHFWRGHARPSSFL